MAELDSTYFSKEGLAKLKKELESLKTKKRKEIAGRLEYAKSLGDLSENSEYQEAKESQIMNEAKIAELEDMLRRAVVVEHSASRGQVDIGSQVAVEDISGKRLNFTIVGANEASPAENKISNESPLGKALLNHKKGETVSAHTPKGVLEYKIVDII
ncbi:transcription elongation factor GreA [Candidatus Giovannonibacteria bacterium RIFCSPLOWO2_01_FULL_43_160]|uniref:Transcription elongation factor GreA n=2 Tax=Candidatus Giovannoniibacteriota TaxID=1752738 RepID=A0A0G1L3X7_9BACT|nr:MAG: Transcription elongation factor GreA [Candidatus Giovannonibacteria bacterium GW2011_GWB1_43_13]KKS99328.1 MAG: Transcription elongation factor GreA [Candidatus Giovannonibacteria bacterium GW2011_GWA1_43_15]KKT21729.1 MAG: Transcription elongation factor GreA [Candidatus Giovannonibacteria bacterium GW2011_GWC2_43_8]KKT63302.1 MAG: Transcription elongation factor GreA [Candidatus Giovannonibacteria bacterium GW2011_GWA2_44_26]OGF59228.1 MAG: transcription elongation factor GreA [Candid